MINEGKAIKIAHNNMPGFAIRNITNVGKYYIVDFIPEDVNSDGLLSAYMDCTYKINIKTGDFSIYNPLIDEEV